MLTGGETCACAGCKSSRRNCCAAQMHRAKYTVPATASKAQTAATMVRIDGMESCSDYQKRSACPCAQPLRQEGKAYNQSHKSLCIRARLQPCRNSLNKELGLQPLMELLLRVQALKPRPFLRFGSARLKSCPDTNRK